MMRQLNWKQPYAELMFHGKTETRTWDTQYRGLVLIVASREPYTLKQIEALAGVDQFRRIHEITPLSKYALSTLASGVGIGVGELFDTYRMQPTFADRCFVKYNFDLFCHEYRNVRRITPFTVKGVMGWKGIAPEQEKYILNNLVL